MSAVLDTVHAPQRKRNFRWWFDRLDFRGDLMNISDRTLDDIGLLHRETRSRPPTQLFWL